MLASPINMLWQEGFSGLWWSSPALPAKGRRSTLHWALAALETLEGRCGWTMGCLEQHSEGLSPSVQCFCLEGEN